jgi:BMFP domain-containing protein YqiC
MVRSQVQRFIADMDLVKREDYDALRELVAAQGDELATLKKDIAALKTRKKTE